MKRLGRPAVIATVTVVALLSCGVMAYGNWSTDSGSATVTVRAGRLPRGDRPTVVADGSNVAVSWAVGRLPSGGPVHGYLVTRHDAAGRSTEVCGGLVVRTGCTDSDVPPGKWWYTVRPAQERWLGAASTGSAEVRVGGPATGERRPDRATSGTGTGRQVPTPGTASRAEADRRPPTGSAEPESDPTTQADTPDDTPQDADTGEDGQTGSPQDGSPANATAPPAPDAGPEAPAEPDLAQGEPAEPGPGQGEPAEADAARERADSETDRG